VPCVKFALHCEVVRAWPVALEAVEKHELVVGLAPASAMPALGHLAFAEKVETRDGDQQICLAGSTGYVNREKWISQADWDNSHVVNGAWRIKVHVKDMDKSLHFRPEFHPERDCHAGETQPGITSTTSASLGNTSRPAEPDFTGKSYIDSSRGDCFDSLLTYWRDRSVAADKLKTLSVHISTILDTVLDAQAPKSKIGVIIITPASKAAGTTPSSTQEAAEGVATPKFKEASGESHAFEVVRSLKKLWKEMPGPATHAELDICERVLRALLASEGEVWQTEGLEKFSHSPRPLPPSAAEDPRWMSKFQAQQPQLLKLAGHVKGFLVLSSSGKLHLAGVTLAKANLQPDDSMAWQALTAANFLQQFHPKLDWNIVEASETGCRIYYPSHAGGRHLQCLKMSRVSSSAP